MKYLLSFFLISFSFFATAQTQFVFDENATVREMVGSFKNIHVSSAIHLVLTKGDTEIIAVSANDDAVKASIKTEIVEGVLKIYYSGTAYRSGYNKKMNVYVSYKNLESIKATDASNVLLADKLTAPTLAIKVSDASIFKGEINVDNLEVKVSDASSIKISGTAKDCSIKCSDASSFNSYNFIATNADIIATDASSIRLTVAAQIDASARDASSIMYKGAATIRKNFTRDASTIKHVD